MSTSEPFSLFQWIDTGIYTAKPMHPLAVDEALVNAMSRPDAKPVIHLWVYDQAFYLGRRDAKLPHLAHALQTFSRPVAPQTKGYGCVLRSSGGACVPLDAGVLNMAIQLPTTDISIDGFFKMASDMLTVGLRDYGTIEFGEVTDSYCVGDYDFALSGKKIGGMAQRRTRHGSVLQLCINIEGSGQARGELMEQFYLHAGLHEMEPQQKPIPGIKAETIGSLTQHHGKFVTVEEVKERLFRSFTSVWDAERAPLIVNADEVGAANEHLTERLRLFSFTADEIRNPEWKLPL
ncbi:lipoate--protein ligase family protein [Brevibacillus dissolubilis]|uniref:lipoate--protein ligase family protein n=1 Tax=Brevibacillus dissolubilis TaxID=1844116 RepID=UPI0020FFFFE3|nr:lipoate--protein ligase family protein [Brevibacillus dissolubilis]